ncbi:MAG: TPM domain-containing protein [Candidatus Saccharimonas sp.]
MRKIWVLGSLLLIASVTLLAPNLTRAASQPPIPAAPSLAKPVIDQTGTLTEQQIDAIAARITETRGQKDYQLGVLMIKTLDGYPIEDYAIKVAREWGIGQKDKNNGILLLIAKDDRRMRIEVGSGLEGDLTDVQSNHVINDVIAPDFKKGEYYTGIYKGVDSLSALVQGQPDPNAGSGSGSASVIDIVLSFGWIGFFLLMWLGSVLARSKSWWAGGVVGGVVGLIVAIIFGIVLWTIIAFVALIIIGLVLDLLVSRNYKEHQSLGDLPAWWAGGGWGGGGSGGGGGGFGGGGFSGGGSSGSW